MTLTQEDVLRELELLPVWLQRQVAANVEETHQAEVSEAAAPVADTADMQAARNEEAVEKIAMPWVLVYEVAESQTLAGQVLMQNIAKAMHLSQGSFMMLPNPEQANAYQADNVVLFGQAALNAVLDGTSGTLESMRGKPQAKSGVEKTQYWVTESIEAMLDDASLKRQVWQDLQIILAAITS